MQDKSYTILTGEDWLGIAYPASATEANKTYSFFLVTAGYYHNLYKSDTGPDIQALLKFKEKGAFDRFSRTSRAAIEQELAKAVVK